MIGATGCKLATATVATATVLGGCGSHPGHARAREHVAAQPPAGARERRAPPRAGRGGGALPSLPAQDAALARFARSGLPVYCGGRGRPLVALTFDDGPGVYTGLALRELRGAGARATFFLVGRSIAQFPGWAARDRAVGAIGEHTLTHPYLPGVRPAAAAAEVAGGQGAARRAAGVPVLLFRPPYGSSTPAVGRLLRRLGMVDVLWDVDSGDSWVSPPQNFAAIARNVLRNVRPGSIVLMHENRGQTIRALHTILPALRRRGLLTVTVPQLLAADPPSSRQLRNGWQGCEAHPVRGTGG